MIWKVNKMVKIKIELIEGFQLKDHIIEPAIVKFNNIFGTGWETIKVINEIVNHMSFVPIWFYRYSQEGDVLFYVSPKLAENPQMIEEAFKKIRMELEEELIHQKVKRGEKAIHLQNVSKTLKDVLDNL